MVTVNSPNKVIKFTESEQELYDAILDEYNDIYEKTSEEQFIKNMLLISNSELKLNEEILSSEALISSFEMQNPTLASSRLI